MSRIIKDGPRYKPFGRTKVARPQLTAPPSSTELFTLPTELHAEIFSYLDQQDERATCHACHALRTIALRFWTHIAVNSPRELAIFFFTTLEASDMSPAALNIAEWKRAHWESLREVEIIPWTYSSSEPIPALAPVPAMIGGRPVELIPLRRLSLGLGDFYLDQLMPVLRSFSPAEVQVREDVSNRLLARLANETGWTEVTKLSRRIHIPHHPPPSRPASGRVLPPAVFDKVTSASLVFTDHVALNDTEPADAIDDLLGLCPNLVAPLRLSAEVQSHQSSAADLREMVRDGLAGKPASFFQVGEGSYPPDVTSRKTGVRLGLPFFPWGSSRVT